MARSQWIPRAYLEHLLAAMMPSNALAIRISANHGLRIGDVLRMTVADVRKNVWSFKEEKTGKRRRVKLSEREKRQLLSIAGKIYVFEHRLDHHKHRTRQAVYKDIKRAAKYMRVPLVSPHTARKIYSVEQYRKSGGNMTKVQRLLNHDDEAVTILYALADKMSKYKNL